MNLDVDAWLQLWSLIELRLKIEMRKNADRKTTVVKTSRNVAANLLAFVPAVAWHNPFKNERC